jgi:hypothetical protein
MIQQLGPDRHAIAMPAEPEQGKEDELLEFTEIRGHAGLI